MKKLYVLLSFLLIFNIANAQLMINELQGANPGDKILDGNGDKSDWIELYNNTPNAIDLSIYYISDDNTESFKWKFPTGATLSAGGRIVLFASSKDALIGSNYHTNFKIDIDETIYLSDTSGALIDIMEADWVQAGYSKARQLDGSSIICFCSAPTPNATNVSYVCYTQKLAEPEFSITTGYYTGTQSLTFNSPKNTLVYYTLDGSKPTIKSKKWNGIAATIDSSRVVRARAFKSGFLPSKIRTETYILNQTTKLKIVSICTDPKNLWDPTNGIYNTNAARAGKKVEGHVEILDNKGKTVYELDADISAQGYASAGLPQKPLQVDAQSYYDSSKINYQIFPSKKIYEFKGFKLRQAGTDWLHTNFKDAVCQTASRNTYGVIIDWVPCVVYLNGKYWGLYDFREKQNNDFVEKNLNINSDNVGYASFETPDALADGYSAAKFITIDSFYNTANASNTDYLNESNKYFDYKSIVDYIASETYFGNIDWPGNNVRYFFTNLKDVPCRYLLWDLDYTMNDGNGNLSSQFANPFSYSRTIKGLHGTLMKNKQYRNYFINRYCDLMNTELSANKTLKIATMIYDSIRTEMPYAMTRWVGSSNFFSDAINGDTTGWGNRIRTTFNWLENRPSTALSNLRTHIGNGLANAKEITLNVSPKGSGVIKINTIKPIGPYPWKGNYFDTAYVTITAIPNPGYTFNNWSANTLISSTSKQTIYVKLTAVETFLANFTGTKAKAKVAISEVNYNSDFSKNAGDWIELHNYGTNDIDLSEWRLEANAPYKKFIFPLNTKIKAGKYLVLTEDSIKFKIQNPGIPFLGNIGWGLDGGGDVIELYNAYDSLHKKIIFKDNGDFPLGADGAGHTLELKNDSADATNANNWFDGCLGGSAGTAYVPCSDIIKVTEMNVKSRWELDAGDWLEVYNPAATDLNIGNYKLRDDNDNNIHVFPAGTTIKAKTRVIFATDTLLFKQIYPFVPASNIILIKVIKFGSDGDAVRLYNTSDKIVFGMKYGELGKWPIQGRGDGRTLEFKDSITDASVSVNWKAGCIGGSPMSTYSNCPTDSLFISEINYQSPTYNDANDWFEVNNYGKKAKDISAYKLTDGGGGLFTVPSATSILANEYKVFTQKSSKFNPIYSGISNIGSFSYGLSSTGEALRIYNATNQLVYFIKFNDSGLWLPKATGTGYTIEYKNGDPSRPFNWVIGCIGGSPGRNLSACVNDSFAFTELNIQAAANQNTGDWIELKNLSRKATSLNNWKIKTTNNTYNIGGKVVFDSGKAYVVIMADSNKFKPFYNTQGYRYNQASNLTMNASDSITLLNETGFAVRAMKYLTTTPWPTDVLGTSKTMEMIRDTFSYNKFSNWRVGCPGGSPFNKISPCINSLQISEINYQSDSSQRLVDWVELQNMGKFPFYGEKAVLTTLSDTITLNRTFKLEPNQLYVYTNDSLKFIAQNAYLANLRQVKFNLLEAENIKIQDTTKNVLVNIAYNSKAPWYPLANGWGRTIQLKQDSVSNSNANNWSNGCIGGTPGYPNTFNCNDSVYITEVMPSQHPDISTGDWVEIFNNSNSIIDVSNFSLANREMTLFNIPSNTTIAPKESIVLAQDTAKYFSVYTRTNKVTKMPSSMDLKASEKLRLINLVNKPILITGYNLDTTWKKLQLMPSYTYNLVSKVGLTYDVNNYRIQCLLGSPNYTQINPCIGDVKTLALNFAPMPIATQEKFVVLKNSNQYLSSKDIDIKLGTNHVKLRDRIILPNQHIILTNDSLKASVNFGTLSPKSIFRVNIDVSDKLEIVVFGNKKIIDFASLSSTMPEVNGFSRSLLLNGSDDTIKANWVETCYNNYDLKANSCTYPLEIAEVSNSSRNWFRQGTWLEILNTTNASINLNGYTIKHFADTNTIRLSGAIAVGKRAIVAEKIDSFKKFQGDTFLIVGTLPYTLKTSDTMVFLDKSNKPVQVMIYSNSAPWPMPTNDGHTIIINKATNNNHYTFANHYKQGCMLGTPGYETDNCRTVSVKNITTKSIVRCFPNPTTGIVNVVSEKEISQISIINMLGKEIINTKETVIDMSAFASSNYLVKVTLKNGEISIFSLIKN